MSRGQRATNGRLVDTIRRIEGGTVLQTDFKLLTPFVRVRKERVATVEGSKLATGSHTSPLPAGCHPASSSLGTIQKVFANGRWCTYHGVALLAYEGVPSLTRVNHSNALYLTLFRREAAEEGSEPN